MWLIFCGSYDNERGWASSSDGTEGKFNFRQFRARLLFLRAVLRSGLGDAMLSRLLSDAKRHKKA